MLKLLLVRHGETDWNRSRRIMGDKNIGLNSTGRDQAVALQRSLTKIPIRRIYSSPLLRARETSEILCEGKELETVFDQRLTEVNYGEWVGKTFHEVREIPGYVPYFKRPEMPVAPRGESLHQVTERIRDFFSYLKQEARENETFLAVSHADTIKCLLLSILEVPLQNIWKLRVDPAAVSLIESDDYGDRLICLNQRGDMTRLLESRLTF